MGKVDHRKLADKYELQERKFQDKADRAKHFKEQHQFKADRKKR